MKDKEVYEKTLELYNGCCAICGKPYPHLHHIRYGACGRKTYIGNVIPLCKQHHDLVHTNKRKYQPMLIKMINRRLIMTNEFFEEHYEEIYERYCEEHPEEITSDFILEEDGNQDYIDEIIEEIVGDEE